MPGSVPSAPSRRTTRPLWLGQQGRLSTVSPLAATGILALLILFVAIAIGTQAMVEPVGDHLSPVSRAMLDHVRHGQSFYSAAIDALRENGRALRPALIAVPLPALTVTLAALPEMVGQGLMVMLGVAVLASWLRRVAPVISHRGPLILAAILLAAGLYPLIDRAMAAVPEAWAAMLIPLSLVQRRPEGSLSAVALGLAAMILSPVALLHGMVMLALAWQAEARREAIGWMVALAIALLILAAHAHALNDLVSGADPAMGSPFFVLAPGSWVASLASINAVGFLPMVLVVPLTALAALGWANWRQALARRAGMTMLAYGVAALLTGAPAMMLGLSPLFFLGVVFAPDAVRELIVAARDRRRITVTRVVR
jgi:hypothetical protein